MYFHKKIWNLIKKSYLKKRVKLKQIMAISKCASSSIPYLFWKRRRKKIKVRLGLLRRRQYYVHNGRYFVHTQIWKNRYPLLYYAETITYGERKKKKKWVNKVNFY